MINWGLFWMVSLGVLALIGAFGAGFSIGGAAEERRWTNNGDDGSLEPIEVEDERYIVRRL